MKIWRMSVYKTGDLAVNTRLGHAGGRHWADLVATSGQISWPPVGSSYCPLAVVLYLICCIERKAIWRRTGLWLSR